MRTGFFSFLLSIAISFFSDDLIAQNKVIDSLLTVLTVSKEDTNKVKLLQDISLKFLNAGERH